MTLCEESFIFECSFSCVLRRLQRDEIEKRIYPH